jgi:pimeloyl-ACP methyl ester carboxylesterase
LEAEPGRAGAVEPRYAIQLPPEYDPLRSYPCIVALHPLRATPEAQIDWWAGGYDEAQRTRMGQASRHGFIVVAPRWSRGEQSRYEYTPREHERVLAAVRDAMRRAQIDSDRVFIVGHGEGATAAWDIGVSHPDIWAGLISISAEPAKTIAHYNANAEYLPVYLVMGESDRAPPPLTRIGGILDDYINFDSDAMVVMYRGRGLEYFPEETPRFFEWMKLASHTRRDVPREIEAATMRDGDRFFWWLELGQLKPLISINPILWDQAERIRAGKVSGSVLADNQIRIGSVPAESVTVWLRPGMGIDLAQRVTIRRGSRPTYFDFDRDLEVMLEDARSRADRKRPYWAKIEL